MIFAKINRAKAIEQIDFWFDKGLKVKIDAVRPIRSLSQNALYWLWLTAISQKTGNEKDDLHEFFAKKFLPMQEAKVFGKIIYKKTSTRELDTAIFKQYLDKIQIFASGEGIELLNPGDKHFDEFKEYYEKYL